MFQHTHIDKHKYVSKYVYLNMQNVHRVLHHKKLHKRRYELTEYGSIPINKHLILVRNHDLITLHDLIFTFNH